MKFDFFHFHLTIDKSSNESNKKCFKLWEIFLPEFDGMEFVALLADVRCNRQDHVLNIQKLKTIPVDFHDPRVVESHLKV